MLRLYVSLGVSLKLCLIKHKHELHLNMFTCLGLLYRFAVVLHLTITTITIPSLFLLHTTARPLNRKIGGGGAGMYFKVMMRYLKASVKHVFQITTSPVFMCYDPNYGI